jgi:hypothetical protein
LSPNCAKYQREAVVTARTSLHVPEYRRSLVAVAASSVETPSEPMNAPPPTNAAPSDDVTAEKLPTGA